MSADIGSHTWWNWERCRNQRDNQHWWDTIRQKSVPRKEMYVTGRNFANVICFWHINCVNGCHVYKKFVQTFKESLNKVASLSAAKDVETVYILKALATLDSTQTYCKPLHWDRLRYLSFGHFIARIKSREKERQTKKATFSHQPECGRKVARNYCINTLRDAVMKNHRFSVAIVRHCKGKKATENCTTRWHSGSSLF